MKLIPIFDTYLYSYHDNDTNFIDEEFESEFERAYRLNTNYHYVYDYFDQNIEYTKSEYFKKNYGSKQKAMIDIPEHTKILFRRIKECCKEISERNNGCLDTIFKPLKNNETHKMLGSAKVRQNLVRLYAIRMGENRYVVTGGAIKLVEQMSQHLDTEKELMKLNKLRYFLKENGVYDEEGFLDFYIEEYAE